MKEIEISKSNNLRLVVVQVVVEEI